MRSRRRRTGRRDPLRSAAAYREPLPVTQMRRYASGDCYCLCPRCSRCVDREYVRFCSQCGQRLSWRALSDAEIIEVPG